MNEVYVPIFAYHSVSDRVCRGLMGHTISPRLFEQHIHYLAEAGFKGVTVSDLIRLRESDFCARRMKPVVLTFDDGLADFHHNTLPILLRYGFSATLYVVSGLIGDKGRWLAGAGDDLPAMLSKQQLMEIQSTGVEIGSHTVAHPMLDCLPVSEAKDEIVSSKRALEEMLDIEIRSFAYPYGYYSASVRQLVVSAGYTSACAVNYRLSPIREDRFTLSRQAIRRETSVTQLAAMLRGGGMRTRYYRVRSRAWTFVRRARSQVMSHDIAG